jgi:hypothetical protein
VSKWHGNNLPVIKKRLAFVVLVFEIEILCGIFLKCFDRTDAVTAAAYHDQVDMGASTQNAATQAQRNLGTLFA